VPEEPAVASPAGRSQALPRAAREPEADGTGPAEPVDLGQVDSAAVLATQSGGEAGALTTTVAAAQPGAEGTSAGPVTIAAGGVEAAQPVVAQSVPPPADQAGVVTAGMANPEVVDPADVEPVAPEPAAESTAEPDQPEPATTSTPATKSDFATKSDSATTPDSATKSPVRVPPAIVRPPVSVLDSWRETLDATQLADTLLVSGGFGAGTLDLTHAHPSGLATLLAGAPTRLSSLIRGSDTLWTARQLVRDMRAAVGTLRLERGMRAGYLAVGVASWRSGLSGPLPGRSEVDRGQISAPILLRGCALSPRGSSHDDYDLVLDGTALANGQLLRRLQSDYGVGVDGVALAGLAFGADGFDPGPVFRRLEEDCRAVPGFRIERSLLLGTFSAGSADLRADLDAAQPALQAHRLLARALTGQPGPGRVAGHGEVPGERALVGRGPAEPGEALDGAGAVTVDPFDQPPGPGVPVDLDPAQRRALEAVERGDDVAVEGPPGSGLTQTAVAAIGAAIAGGRSVLVVTPHQGTAEALVSRLAGAGLGDAVLDLHDGSGDRDAILAALGRDLDDAVEAASGPDGATAVASGPDGAAAAPSRETAERRFNEARTGLQESARALHAVREPWGVRAYDAMVTLAALMAGQHAPLTRVRLPQEVTRRLDTTARERLRAHLREAAALGAFTLTRVDTRWLDARVTTDEEAERALEAAARARDALPKARAAMDAVSRVAGLAPAQAAGEWVGHLELLLGVRNTLDVMLPTVYEQPIDELIEATKGRAGRSADGRPLGRMARRQLRRRARMLVRPGVHVPDLHAVLERARRQKAAWRAADEAGGWPRVPTGLAQAQTAVEALDRALATVCDCLRDTGTPDLLALPVEKLAQRLADLACDGEGLRDQPRRTVLLDRLREAGLGDLIGDLRQRRVGPEAIDGELDLAWWTSVLEALIRSDPRLARHDPLALRRWAAQLREADIELAAAGLGEALRQRAVAARQAVRAHPAQVRWLRAEVVRGHRSVWPADLFGRARDLVTALRPVWVMSPDAVARLLPPAGAGRPLVDLVVVDDANQVGMPEAAASLARGRQVLVAGDRRRLPPATGGPSVLDVVAGVVGVHRLGRDHRARDGRLVDLLTDLYPEGWQVTPGAAAGSPVTLVPLLGAMVPGGRPALTQTPGQGGQYGQDGPETEVARVVDLVTDHALRRPGESLLVVTLGGRHAERIEGALRSAATHDPALAAWLDVHWTGGIDEPFCVRPVHRLAGLERDASIVSLGLPRRPQGKAAAQPFGALDGRFGVACLVAALSRGRRHTELVCAFTADDLTDERVVTPGARMLRDLLESLGQAPPGRAAGVNRAAGTPDPLVADLRERLRAVGMPVQAGFPAPDRPLDLAVGDPLEPGRMLLAIDLDGPGYASGPSVRLRDRQRAQDFERAGWSYLRVAAMDLFCDPEGEVERIQDAWRAAGGLPASVVPSRVVPTPPPTRLPWPDQVAPGLPISAYTPRELDAVARWVVSDGAVRSPEQAATEVRAALGLVRREPRVDAAVGAACRRALQEAAVSGR
jgi:hypothetical protein